MGKLLSKAIQNRAVQHALFWALSFVLLLRFFTSSIYSSSDEIHLSDVIYTFLFHISLVSSVYLNIALLIPVFLKTKRYLWYLGLVFFTLLTGILLNNWTFNYLADLLFPGYYFISYYEFWDLVQFMAVYLAATTLLKLSKAWFELNEQEKKFEQLEKEKLDAELSSLKAQLDPHFLFNNLNNLYSLTLDKDKRTPEIILKLSHTMRYMLYECRGHTVLLQKELQYIRNYLKLEELRMGKNAKIQFEIRGEVKDQKVAPLLFLPFIENSFKHGIKGDQLSAFMHIYFDISNSGLIFSVENNKGSVDEAGIEMHRGLGLKNIRRRLELLYPGKHELNIIDKDDTFRVQLKLDMA